MQFLVWTQICLFFLLTAFSCRPVETGNEFKTLSGSEDIKVALGDSGSDGTDVFVGLPKGYTDQPLCRYESADPSAEGVCFPLNPDRETSDRNIFVTENVSITEKIFVAVKAKDQSGVEVKQKLKFKSKNGDDTVTTIPVDPTTPPPQVTPPVEEEQAIPQSMNLTLGTPQGGTTTVDKIFKGKYLLVELSAYDCGPCRNFASSFNRQESKYGRYFESGKCSKLIMIGNYGYLHARYSNWVSMLGKDSFVGGSSYSTSLDLGQVAKKFGFNRSFGIPTLIIVDRQGQVVDSATVAVPGKLGQLCQ